MKQNMCSKSLVIPTYTLNDKLRDMAYCCVTSHRSQVNEIIITEDGGNYSRKLKDIADIYVYNHKNCGFTVNVNKGWSLATGDFVIIANSDVELVEGNLVDICREGQVCGPEVINLDNYPQFTGAYWSVSRDVTEQYGMLDERLKNFDSDTDYFERIKHIFHKDSRVKIKHHKSQTLQDANLDVDYETRMDAQRYRDIVQNEYPERITWSL